MRDDPYRDQLVADYLLQRPSAIEQLPRLTDEEVERFGSLGEQARRGVERGEYPQAMALFAQQLTITAASPEPHAGLAEVSALLGDDESAHQFLRDAVVRGFADFDRFHSSPGLESLRLLRPYRVMERTAPHLDALGREAARWNAVQVDSAPTGVEQVEQEYEEFLAQLEQVSPVLGADLAGAWERWLDFAAAALLERYVAEHPYAEDSPDAVVWLFKLYSDSDQFRWTTLAPEATERLAHISRVVLETYPELNLRADAWVADALATYSRSRGSGDQKLGKGAITRIERSLGTVIERHPNSPRRFDATVGLILVAAADERIERARQLHRELLARYGGDDRLMQRADDELGDLKLRLTGLPPFETATIDGQEVSPAWLAGKVVLLDVWATWCGPCVDSFDSLRKLQEKHAEDGLLILGLSMDSAEEIAPDELRKWLVQHEVAWPQIYDGKGWDSEIAGRLAVREIPYTVLIADGEVLGTNLHGKQLEKEVASAMRSLRKTR